MRQTLSDGETEKGAMVRGLSDRGEVCPSSQPGRQPGWPVVPRLLRGKAASLAGMLSDAGTPSMSRKAWHWVLGKAHHRQTKQAVGGGVGGGTSACVGVNVGGRRFSARLAAGCGLLWPIDSHDWATGLVETLPGYRHQRHTCSLKPHFGHI